jgi:starch phosphorylase
MGNLLPRHLQLIYLINYYFLEKIKSKYPENIALLNSLSLIEEANPK